MREDLRQRVLSSISQKYGYKVRGKYLREIKCPSCEHKEAYSFEESPWVIKCGRESNCGHEHHIKDLFPELFADWSKDYPQTPTNPNASADAYLTQARGFKPAIIKGWYYQGSHRDGATDQWTATVKFNLPNNATFERFIDRPERFGSRKGTLSAYRGFWWSAPTGKFSELSTAKEIWITEGIFNAIALMHADKFAVSSMSSGSYPDESLGILLDKCRADGIKRPSLVWALDSDPAGQKFTLKHIERARADGWTCRAAQAPDSDMRTPHDWNEHLLRGKLNDWFFEKALFLGDLLLAKDAAEKGALINERTNRSFFPFEFKNELFWYELKSFEKSEPKPVVSNICTCVPTVLYKQSNLNTDEHWFYFKVDFPYAKPYKLAFTNSQIASSAEFKKRLLVAHGGLFTGKTSQLDVFIKNQMRHLKTVDTIDYIGYTREYGMYIFGGLAVNNGKVLKLNSEDFFEVGGNVSIKTLSSQHLKINPDLNEFKPEFFKLIYQAYGAKGLVALSFWFGTLFAEQIRKEQESFPFLELIGEPGTGKSTLLAFLWRLVGRNNYEGFDPNKASLAARGRNMMQLANLPVVFLESDRADDASKRGRFDFDELKTAYNGGAPWLTGQKNNGNGTNEQPFKGSVVISQNAVVKASAAILERIVHLPFVKKDLTPDTLRASFAITRLTSDDVSGFILKAATSEAATMATIVHQTTEHGKLLHSLNVLKNGRVIKNHAQILACWSAMREVFPSHLTQEMDNDIVNVVVDMAIDRERALESDHPLVTEFWEVVEFLESTYDDKAVVDHSMDPQLIAINLRHIEQVAADRKVRLPLLAELRDLLRTSRKHRFLELKSVGSAINRQYNAGNPLERRPTTVKCWVFEK